MNRELSADTVYSHVMSIPAGREWSSRGDRVRMPSHSPQDYREDPAERRRGTGKSRSKSVSPKNGLEPRNGQRSPYGRLGEKAGERDQYRDAKQHR